MERDVDAINALFTIEKKGHELEKTYSKGKSLQTLTNGQVRRGLMIKVPYIQTYANVIIKNWTSS